MISDRTRWVQRLVVVRRLLTAIPTALGALIGAVVVLGVSWALIVPPFQAPDEPTHFAYAQSLAERFALPGDGHRPAASSDQRAADAAAGASGVAFHPAAAKPEWSAAGSTRYRALARGFSRSDGGGPNSFNPPLYYLYADLAYWAAGGDSIDRLYAMRIWGVGLLVVTVVGAWLLAGEVFRRRRLPQLAASAVAGMVPMETFISTSVNPDAMMVALWTIALWLGARVVRRAAQRRDAVALCAVTAGAILTKGSSYALVPAVLLALVIGWRRRPAQERSAGSLAIALLALALPVLGWIGFATALGRAPVNMVGPPPDVRPRPFKALQFLSYVWQFYLPRLPGLDRFRATAELPVYDLWLREGWGVFGWVNVPLGHWIYRVLAAVSGTIGVVGAATLATFRDRLRLELVAFFALALLALLSGLHVDEYRSVIAGQGPIILQGRYLLPVVALLGLAVGVLVVRLPVARRGPACGVLVAALLALQVLSLATVAREYYT